ncbi:MAG: hypothetical protein AAGK10_15735, partial [Cyanobacteria bacterium J06555_3]
NKRKIFIFQAAQNVAMALRRLLMKVILYLVTAPALLLAASIAKAQTPTPANFGNSGGQINDVRPISQPGTVFDSNSGSRQFFQQGRDKLYFLPAEESEPILQIDDGISEDVEENTEDTVNSRDDLEQAE